MTNEPRRAPARSVIAAYLHGAVASIGLLSAMVVYLHSPALWPGPWAAAVPAALIVWRAAAPLWSWATHRYAVSDEGIGLFSGTVHRRARFVATEDVRIVDVDQPWAYRLFGLTIVTIGTDGDSRTAMRWEGVSTRVAEDLRALVHPTPAEVSRRAAAPTGLSSAASPVDVGQESAPEILYRARDRDLVIDGLVHGQTLLAGAAGVAAAADVLGDLPWIERSVSQFAPDPWVAGAVAAGVLIATGSVVLILRYGGLTLTRARDGRIDVSYGLISRRVRRVNAEGVVGVLIRRSPIEMLRDRARLSLIGLDTMAPADSVRLPSLALDVVRPLVRSLREVPGQAGAALPGVSRAVLGRTATTALIASSTGAGAGALAWARGWTSVPLLLLVGITAGLIAVWAISIAQARLTVEEHVVRWRTVGIAERVAIVAARRIHVVHDIDLHVVRLVVVHYFAGRPRRLWTFARDRTIGQRLESEIGHREAGSVARREELP